MSKKKTLGFALGSGGSRGVAHIGFLAAMDEAGLRPDYLTGCSMGSIVGAAYAAGMAPKEIQAAVKQLKPTNILDVSMHGGGLFGTGKIKKLVGKYIGKDLTFDQLKIPYRCVAVDMYTQSVVTFSKGNVVDAAVASSCIPAVFKPIERDGMRLVDGGILERVPASQLKEMGADVVVAVDVLGQRPCTQKRPNTIGMLLQMFDLMDNHRTRRRREENEGIIDLWLEPDLGTMSIYDFNRFPYAYEQGYKLGMESAEKIKDLL